MTSVYEPSLTMAEARRQYFADNGFGADGGYSDKWVDFSLGPVKFPFPNTPARVKAVRFHDLHHVMTGYRTDIIGEFEISAWELGAGCKDFGAAWVLNLGGTFAGVCSAPRRVFRAFVRGLRSRSLYDAEFEPLLPKTVGEIQAERLAADDAGPGAAVKVRPLDLPLFAVTAASGLIVGSLFLALVVPLLPFGFLYFSRKRRGDTATAA